MILTLFGINVDRFCANVNYDVFAQNAAELSEQLVRENIVFIGMMVMMMTCALTVWWLPGFGKVTSMSWAFTIVTFLLGVQRLIEQLVICVLTKLTLQACIGYYEANPKLVLNDRLVWCETLASTMHGLAWNKKNPEPPLSLDALFAAFENASEQATNFLTPTSKASLDEYVKHGREVTNALKAIFDHPYWQSQIVSDVLVDTEQEAMSLRDLFDIDGFVTEKE